MESVINDDDLAGGLHERYAEVVRARSVTCSADPRRWHRPDVVEFTELRDLLLPHVKSGAMHCQYAMGTILSQGLCCESEQQFQAGHAAAIEEATRWWTAAARQGYKPALDNLVTCGAYEEANRAKDAWNQLQQNRPDLVGWSDRMPVYGPEFVHELSRKLYGRAFAESD